MNKENDYSLMPVVMENRKKDDNNENIVDNKPKKKKIKWSTGATIITCATLSFVSAFAGSTIGNKVLLQNNDDSVIYQSVIRTANTTGNANSLSVADIAEIASNSVVEIRTEVVETGNRFGQYVAEGAGSGVIITKDGYIVTNNHVIDDASKITVRTADGTSYEASLIGKDAQTDLAVIKIEGNNLTPVVFGNSSNVRVGDLAVAIGNPLGELGGTITDGIVSALEREITIDGENMTLLQTNAAINPGNSGGGLFNSSGELIGIVNAKSSGSDIEGLGFAIPIDTAQTVISELIDNGYVGGRPSLGVTLVDISNSMNNISYGGNSVCVYESQNTNLQSGDIILEINNQEIRSISDIKNIVSKSEIGDELTVKIVRNNVAQNIKVKVLEQNNLQTSSINL